MRDKQKKDKKNIPPMEYCETCKEWVPNLIKHNRKRHLNILK